MKPQDILADVQGPKYPKEAQGAPEAPFMGEPLLVGDHSVDLSVSRVLGALMQVREDTRTVRHLLHALFNGWSDLAIAAPLLRGFHIGAQLNSSIPEYFQQRLCSVDPNPQSADCTPFEQLLLACRDQAKKLGPEYGRIADACDKNYSDERGMQSDGKELPELSHRTLRERFKAALNTYYRSNSDMRDFSIDQCALHGSTNYYKHVLSRLHGLAKEGRVLHAAGALCALELIIRKEYQVVQTVLDRQFPTITKEQRLYIDDHAEHDLKHYGDLLLGIIRAIVPLKEQSLLRHALVEVFDGARRICLAKRTFFEGVRSH